MNSGITVLYVDDNSDNLKMMKAILEPAGFNILLADTGAEALEIIAKTGVDIILLDIMMPQMDGFQAVKAIRDKLKSFVPVVMVTALDSTDDRVKAMESGADDYISRPLDKQELLIRIRALLRIKELSDKLDENFRNLKELENVRDSYIHFIVHDLKNPLTTIMGNIEFVLYKFKDSLPEKIGRFLKQSMMSSEYLLSMINNILNVNEMESLDVMLKKEQFSLNDLVREALEDYTGVMEQEQKKIVFEASERLDLIADRQMIKRVVLNLITNGLASVKQGGNVTIGLINGNRKGFFVRDTGYGVPPEYLGKVFDKFFQIEAKGQGYYTNTNKGLGLTFSKLAVELHGGTIETASKVGEGTEFTVLF